MHNPFLPNSILQAHAAGSDPLCGGMGGSCREHGMQKNLQYTFGSTILAIHTLKWHWSCREHGIQTNIS